MTTKKSSTGTSHLTSNTAPGPFSLLMLLLPFIITGLLFWMVTGQ